MAEDTDTVNNRHQIVTIYRTSRARDRTPRATARDNVDKADERFVTDTGSGYYRKNAASTHNVRQIARISIGIDLTFANPFHVRPVCTHLVTQADECAIERFTEWAETISDAWGDAVVDGTQGKAVDF